MREDCRFRGDDGWCELMFHEPGELERMCPICIEYEPIERKYCGKRRNKMNNYRKVCLYCDHRRFENGSLYCDVTEKEINDVVYGSCDDFEVKEEMVYLKQAFIKAGKQIFHSDEDKET